MRCASIRQRFTARLLSIVLLGAAPAAVMGHEGHEHPAPAKVPDQALHRATAMPDRVVLSWCDDPATTQAVTWRTATTVERALAQIAEGEAGPKFVGKARELVAKTESLETDLGAAHYHSVRFESLEPSTTYVYRVGDGANWSEWFQFRTASDAAEPFSFVYFGDAQNDVRSMWSRVIRQAYSDMPKARFMLHAGDLINRAEADAEWGEWFSAGGWLNAMVPVVPTPGNHEYSKGPGDKRSGVSHHWRPQFTLPENGLESLEETVYWIDYQGTRIVSLNSNEEQERQAAWLDGVLADNPNRWTIVTFHHPIYSASKTRDNPELRELWQPIFDKHRVDLVLQGHDHSYARTGLVGTVNATDGANVVSQAGTVYVVSVSGPKMYDRREPRPEFFERIAEDTQLYQIVTIDGDELRFEARTALGDLYDAFELRKRDGKTNRLVDRTPDMPERVRPSVEEATVEPVAAARVPTFRLHEIDPKNLYSGAAAYDVDGDGRMDIVTGGTWYRAPDWKPHVVREVEYIRGRFDDYSCLPLDVNGDGHIDFVTCNYRSEKLAWIENPGSVGKAWTEHIIEKPGPMETGRLADVDGDGQMDVLPNGRKFAAWWEVVHENDGAGKPGFRWVRHDLPREMSTHGVGFGDIDGDGRGDIVSADGWLEAPPERHTGRWRWHADFFLDRDASVPILVFDADGDGDNDIVWGRGHRTGLCWLEQTAKGASREWSHHVIDSSWSQPHTVECADIDNDGQIEIVAGKRFMGHDGKDLGEWDPLCIYWYDFDRDSRTFTRHTISEGGQPGFDLDPKIVDLDGDGDLDIVAPGRSGLFLIENQLVSDGVTVGLVDASAGAGLEIPADHTKPMVLADNQSVGSPADWATRRAGILHAMQCVMGPLPDTSRRVPVDVEVIEVEDAGKYLRKRITYAAEPGERVPAYLLVPKNLDERAPTMLCLHPTGVEGKKIAAGLAGKAGRGYAHELAERGYVCIVPDYPSMGDYDVDFDKILAKVVSASASNPGDPPHGRYASNTMKAIWNNVRALDVLESLPEVDAERIGVIGHSLGGHNALFTAVFDLRIKAVVTSCGFTGFADYKGGDLSAWAQDKYMPRVRDWYGSDPARMPFDFHEVVAAIAPRPIFTNSPVGDTNFDVGGVKKVMAAAGEVYSLLGASDSLAAEYPDCGHDFPDEIREQAYTWLKKALK